MTTPNENEALIAQSSATGATLTDVLGAFLGEKWAVWYDGTGGYTPAYCHSNGVTLYSSKEEAEKSFANVFSSMSGGYHARKVVIYEAPNAIIQGPRSGPAGMEG